MTARGITLVEIMVGLVIFAVMGLSYYHITSSLSRETQFSMETYHSQLLAMKVGEFINQESMTNPIAPENYNGINGRVVNGETPIFQRVYNQNKTTSFASDLGAIEAESGEFYEQAEKYSLKIETKTDEDEYYSVDCYINWEAKVGKGLNNTSRFFPKVHQARNIVVEKIFSDADLDKFCARYLYLKDPPLESVVTSGDITTIRALGTVFYSSMKFLTDKKFERDIAEIELLKSELSAGVSGSDKIKLVKKLANLSYEMAKNAYLILVTSEDAFSIIRGGYNSSALGSLWNEKKVLKEGFNNYVRMCNVFNENLWAARKAYLELIDSRNFAQLGSRRQYLYLLKTINLSRIISICKIGDSGSGLSSKNLDFLKKLMADFKGRNSHIERLLEQEISFNGDTQKLVEKFPYLESIAKMVGQGNGVAMNLAFIEANVN